MVSRNDGGDITSDAGLLLVSLADKKLGLTRAVAGAITETDDPCHGRQEFEFFNGHYGCHCYLPMHIHITGDDGRQRIIGSALRPGNAGPTKGLYSALRIAIRLVREHLPQAQIILRADSAFGVCEVLDFCEDMGIDYILGMKGNNVLHDLSAPVQMDACLKYRWEGNGCREYGSVLYKAGSWRQIS